MSYASIIMETFSMHVINFKACLRDNSLNIPLPPLHKVPTEGFSA